MSMQANTKLIGVFVVSALALIVAAIIVFGGGKFLSTKTKYVLFFSGSVKGLSVGAPVDFKGVRVGSVVDISLVFDSKDYSFKIPVVIEIEADRVSEVGEEKGRAEEFDQARLVQELVGRGLKAQLGTQSFLTGQLYVAFDMLPDKPIRLSGVKSQYPELPTVQSAIEQIAQTIEQIPLEEIVQKFRMTLDGIERFVNSPELAESRVSLNNALKSIDKLARNLDAQVKPVSNGIQETTGHAKKLLSHVDAQVEPMAGDIKAAAKSLRELAKNSDQNLTPILLNAQSMVEEGSPLRYGLIKAIEDLGAAARSLRALADSLERQPESLIRGKRGAK